MNSLNPHTSLPETNTSLAAKSASASMNSHLTPVLPIKIHSPTVGTTIKKDQKDEMAGLGNKDNHLRQDLALGRSLLKPEADDWLSE